MLKHIVLFKLKDRAEGAEKKANLRKLEDALEDLPGLIDKIRQFEVGINVCAAPAAYDLALYSEFDCQADLDAYQVHPEHQKVVEFVKAVCESRAVVDYNA